MMGVIIDPSTGNQALRASVRLSQAIAVATDLVLEGRLSGSNAGRMASQMRSDLDLVQAFMDELGKASAEKAARAAA